MPRLELSPGRADRQQDVKVAARARLGVVALAFDIDPSAVSVDDPFGDRQAQPWSAAHEPGLAGGMQLGALGAVELVKDAILILDVNAHTAIRHDHFDANRLLAGDRQQPGGDVDAPAVGRVLDRIADQIDKHLVQAQGVSLNRRHAGQIVHLDRLVSALRPQAADPRRPAPPRSTTTSAPG